MGILGRDPELRISPTAEALRHSALQLLTTGERKQATE